MKKLLLALAALVSLPAAAQAQVTPYVEATAANSRFSTEGLDYGITAGLSAPASRNVDLQMEVGAENFADERANTYNVNVGASADLGRGVDLYGKVGYVNTGGNEGYRLGTGLNVGLTRNTYAIVGVERDDYGRGVRSTQGLVGLGVKF